MKKNLPLIVALTLPLLVTLGVVFYVQFSKNSIQPQYDLLYAVNNNDYSNYSNDYYYIVVNNKLQQTETRTRNLPNQVETPLPDSEKPLLYLFDFETETNRSITFEEAIGKGLVKTGNTSPEGYAIQYSYGDYNFIADIVGTNRSNRGWIITDNSVKKFIELTDGLHDQYGGWYGRGNVSILGWVE
jgi:hypothetical protein